jgi:iron complex transport system permease protein
VLVTAGLSLRRGAVASPASLILAGVAVAALLAAVQTYLLQRHADSLRVVYGWLLGRLSTVGWSEVRLVLPILVACTVVLVATAGRLDVLAVGDEEATTLGIRPARTRALVLAVASLATATAVSVSGLIGFVGLIVPHGVRLLAGTRNRRVVPLSMLFGGAFLVLADLVARTIQAPAELPIGVITAFVGAPAFLLVLRSQQARA